MSEQTSAPRRALHLVLEGFPEERLAEIVKANANAEIFRLTEASAKEAVEKIFAAESVAVWTALSE